MAQHINGNLTGRKPLLVLQQGVNPVAALREAQLKMLQTEQGKSPYYWAPFVIQGEWR